MATASDIYADSLRRANIIGENQTPTDNQASRALQMLNDLLASYKSKGLDLQLDSLIGSDTVYLDASDILAIKMNLAVHIADYYKMQMPNSVRVEANDLYTDLHDKYFHADLEEMELPQMFSGGRVYDIETGR